MGASITTVAPKSVSQATYAAGLQVSAASAVLYGLAGYNSSVAAQFIQIHDSATTPADTAVPKFNISVPAMSNYSIDFGLRGMNFVNGIYVCNSSTPQTKTIGAADTQFFARLDAA